MKHEQAVNVCREIASMANGPLLALIDDDVSETEHDRVVSQYAAAMTKRIRGGTRRERESEFGSVGLIILMECWTALPKIAKDAHAQYRAALEILEAIK